MSAASIMPSAMHFANDGLQKCTHQSRDTFYPLTFQTEVKRNGCTGTRKQIVYCLLTFNNDIRNFSFRSIREGQTVEISLYEHFLYILFMKTMNGDNTSIRHNLLQFISSCNASDHSMLGWVYTWNKCQKYSHIVQNEIYLIW